jgi:hypothetical protein
LKPHLYLRDYNLDHDRIKTTESQHSISTFDSMMPHWIQRIENDGLWKDGNWHGKEMKTITERIH